MQFDSNLKCFWKCDTCGLERQFFVCLFYSSFMYIMITKQPNITDTTAKRKRYIHIKNNDKYHIK